MIYLEFIFQSIWHFIGTLLLCGAIFGGVGRIGNKTINNHYESKDKNDKQLPF